ncbi:MAG: ribonuclease P protein component [Chlamydiia bacterium]|nr:ribonuclease P protein component [Chlamydiia bacterium]
MHKQEKDGLVRLIRKGKRFLSGRFLFFYNFKFTGAPLIFIRISKKNGNAVIRNKMKRWIRSTFFDKISEMNNIAFLVSVLPAKEPVSYLGTDLAMDELKNKILVCK